MVVSLSCHYALKPKSNETAELHPTIPLTVLAILNLTKDCMLQQRLPPHGGGSPSRGAPPKTVGK
ncbi:MAG: hypothetical protein IKP58_08965 [Victivallales bacterium]|nr:hypothetical protein [Victivallales bacterium]